MGKAQDIKEAIRQICGAKGGSGLFLVGEVKSVEGETCTVNVAGLELDEVRLTAVNDGADGKLLLTPKEGSMVLLTDLSGGNLRDLAVIVYTNIEKIEATFEQIAIEADSIELNGGDNGGLVNIESLKNNLDTLKKYVEAMEKAIANGFTSVGASTAANGPAGRATFEGAMAAQMINFEDMEDTKITH